MPCIGSVHLLSKTGVSVVLEVRSRLHVTKFISKGALTTHIHVAALSCSFSGHGFVFRARHFPSLFEHMRTSFATRLLDFVLLPVDFHQTLGLRGTTGTLNSTAHRQRGSYLTSCVRSVEPCRTYWSIRNTTETSSLSVPFQTRFESDSTIFERIQLAPQIETYRQRKASTTDS